jgi:hypothetical protein
LIVSGRSPPIDEPQALELVHEEIHAGARRADHIRQRSWDTLGTADRHVLFARSAPSSNQRTPRSLFSLELK